MVDPQKSAAALQFPLPDLLPATRQHARRRPSPDPPDHCVDGISVLSAAQSIKDAHTAAQSIKDARTHEGRVLAARGQPVRQSPARREWRGHRQEHERNTTRRRGTEASRSYQGDKTTGLYRRQQCAAAVQHNPRPRRQPRLEPAQRRPDRRGRLGCEAQRDRGKVGYQRML